MLCLLSHYGDTVGKQELTTTDVTSTRITVFTALITYPREEAVTDAEAVTKSIILPNSIKHPEHVAPFAPDPAFGWIAGVYKKAD